MGNIHHLSGCSSSGVDGCNLNCKSIVRITLHVSSHCIVQLANKSFNKSLKFIVEVKHADFNDF